MPSPRKTAPDQVRVLRPNEYPTSITDPRGAYTPVVKFAATHPLGLYHVEDQGAGHLMAYFTPRRRGSRAKAIGGASDMAGALRRISRHEDELIDPEASRELGRQGPVNMFRLGERTGGQKKTPTQLDAEIEAFLGRAVDE